MPCSAAKDVDLALQSYERALAIEPQNVAALLGMGDALYENGNYSDALHYYEQATAFDPSARGYRGQGNALCAQGEYNRSLPLFDKSLSRNPLDVDALLGKGLALAALGNSSLAIKCFQEIVSVNPGNYAAWSNLGSMQASIGRYDEAARSLEKACQADSIS